MWSHHPHAYVYNFFIHRCVIWSPQAITPYLFVCLVLDMLKRIWNRRFLPLFNTQAYSLYITRKPRILYTDTSSTYLKFPVGFLDVFTTKHKKVQHTSGLYVRVLANRVGRHLKFFLPFLVFRYQSHCAFILARMMGQIQNKTTHIRKTSSRGTWSAFTFVVAHTFCKLLVAYMSEYLRMCASRMCMQTLLTYFLSFYFNESVSSARSATHNARTQRSVCLVYSSFLVGWKRLVSMLRFVATEYVYMRTLLCVFLFVCAQTGCVLHAIRLGND